MQFQRFGFPCATVKIHVPLLLLLGGQLLMGQLPYLRSIPRETSLDTALLTASVLLHVSLATLLIGALLGVVLSIVGKKWAGPFWVLAVIVGGVPFVGFMIWAKFGIHLPEAAAIAFDCIWIGFKVLETRGALVFLGVGLVAGELLLLTVAYYSTLNLRRWGLSEFSVNKWFLVGGTNLALLLGVQLVSASAVSARARVHAGLYLWRLELVEPERASILKFADPTVRQVPSEQMITKMLGELSPPSWRPNIFFFVIESLRKDSITSAIAPNLWEFQKASLPVQEGVAASHCTHVSWYSLFHARHAFNFWELRRAANSKGSTPLRIFKQIGYQTRVLASVNINYSGFRDQTFGVGLPLLDSLLDQTSIRSVSREPAIGTSDRAAINQLISLAEAQDKSVPNLYMVFLNSSHADYYWDEKFEPRFFPFLDMSKIPPMTALLGDFEEANLPRIKNRYHNSVAYVDSLVGDFLNALKRSRQLDNSIIIITGDHGEEFGERKNIYHCNELNQYQVSVPILFHSPKRVSSRVRHDLKVASHVDLLPTVLDALGLSDANRLLQGESLLDSARTNAAITMHVKDLPRYFQVIVDGRKVNFELIKSRVEGGGAARAQGLIANSIWDRTDGLTWDAFDEKAALDSEKVRELSSKVVPLLESIFVFGDPVNEH